ncbi:MAG: toxin-antitoxin system protein [Paludibacteraceae bacterium]|nr:toxin-antitoxin system protein [Paludibacteraceae bacterium]MBP5481717.1 toxin-antitoxin system protein [Paludibacteraceae bacterium]MBR4712564.1 toxin-antitoxin system protein [Paludibacteraceae bacterium]MCR5498627.1 toxin-antitoxin system protein [Paludibacteraceae bacterium]
MGTVIVRKQTAFRLSEKLLADLKIQAQRCNRSLNNYVESLLIEALYNTPNDETVQAIEESKSGKHAGTLNVSSFENFLNSIDEAE